MCLVGDILFAMKSPDSQFQQSPESPQEPLSLERLTALESAATSVAKEAENAVLQQQKAEGFIASQKQANEIRRELGIAEQPSGVSEQEPYKSKAPEAGIKTEVVRHPDESDSEFLFRAGKEVTKQIGEETGSKVFDPYRILENALSPRTKGMIAQVMEEARQHGTRERSIDNSEALRSIEQSIGVNEKKATTEDEFERTQRKRRLFEIQPGKSSASRETYWNTLFFPYNTEATRGLARELLTDKTIVVLGGGHAHLKEEMLKNGIIPREVLNIDPFVSAPELGADPVVPVSATDVGLSEVLRGRGIEKADEIWAEYSVPAYLKDPSEITALFQNIDTLLAENGSARIWPLEVSTGSEEEIQLRKTALMESLTNLCAGEKYELVKFDAAGRAGVFLRRMDEGTKEK